MKHIKTYNESLRDKMKPKSDEDVLKGITDINDAMFKQMGHDDGDEDDFYINPDNIDNVKFLLKNGADPSYKEYAILRYACAIGDEKFVKELFDDYNVPVNACAGIALRTSAEFHHPLLLLYIIHEGGDVKKYGEEAAEFAIDTALNNEKPIISDSVVILVKNGIPKDIIQDQLGDYMGDYTVDKLMDELEEKLIKYDGSK